MSTSRKILHVDMDAFYASVEIRDDPALLGRPVVVGGDGNRGVVAAASYEARRHGIHSAMPMFKARMKCPGIVVVRPRMDVYRSVSAQVREVFARYTDLIEPLSLDEAYLDVTADREGIGSATATARAIKDGIRSDTGLTASAGISYNKFLAKTASGYDKPDGLFVITPSMGPGFVAELEVGRFHGIGAKTAARMKEMGIRTGADLARLTLEQLTRRFGKSGAYYHSISRGVDDREVVPDRIRKSVGKEDTFDRPVRTIEEVQTKVEPIVQGAWARCLAVGATSGRTVTVKVKYADFELTSRQRSLTKPVVDEAGLMLVAKSILREMAPFPKDIRLLGVTLSAFGEGIPETGQLDLDI